MKISINIIPHNRPSYADAFYNEIIKIDASLKKDITIQLLVSSLNRDWKKDREYLKNNGFETDVYLIKDGNYLDKIRTAINNKFDFSIKLDEDVFLPYQLWQYFIENLPVLEDPNNLLLAPILTTGIPTVDLFTEQFLSQNEKEHLYKIYLNTSLPSIWGADYSNLAQHTIKASQWNCENFYNEVNKINHHYTGVHPVRFSATAATFILDYTLNNFDKLLNQSNFYLASLKRPYFCNNVFGIKTSLWKTIVEDKSLIKDEFDEVPISLYRRQNDLNFVFINNGFGVHPAFNTINVFGHDYSKLSDRFFNHEYFKR